MRLCARCDEPLLGTGWMCTACRFEPPVVAGFRAYAAEQASGPGAFEPEVFEQLHSLEPRHYWFRARNALIVWAFRKYFEPACTFLEVGCGTGFVLKGIADAMPGLQIFASELASSALPYAATRVERATVFQMDARAIPYADHFDVIGLFDVLEHVPEHARVLAQVHRALRRGGGLLLTVPQHPFLWSQFDEHAGHVRRYTARALARMVADSGFRIMMRTSFVSLLLPVMALSRLAQRAPRTGYDACAELRVGGVANAVLGATLTLERALIRGGVRFPAGGSLLLVAERA